MKSKRILGAHLSIAGGLHSVFNKAEALGCDCVQIFTRNNMQWKAPPVSPEARRLFLAEQKRSAINPVIAHANYLINLASPDKALWQKSLESFCEEIKRAQMLSIPFLIIHPGSHVDSGERRGEQQVSAALNRALEKFSRWKGTVLLETTAGQGSGLGHTFESLQRICAQVDSPDRLGFCMDTCHIFSAGYDIRTVSSYKKTLEAFDMILGLARLHVVHMNDSKGSLAGRIDRHEHIGKGRLGSSTFRHFLRDQRLAHIPFIIETPKGKSEKGQDLDEINLNKLRNLL